MGVAETDTGRNPETGVCLIGGEVVSDAVYERYRKQVELAAGYRDHSALPLAFKSQGEGFHILVYVDDHQEANATLAALREHRDAKQASSEREER